MGFFIRKVLGSYTVITSLKIKWEIRFTDIKYRAIYCYPVMFHT